jgi:hypothetical protein
VHGTQLEEMTGRALVDKALVTALLDSARAVSATLQGELQRPHWGTQDGKEGLTAALSLLLAHLGRRKQNRVMLSLRSGTCDLPTLTLCGKRLQWL